MTLFKVRPLVWYPSNNNTRFKSEWCLLGTFTINRCGLGYWRVVLDGISEGTIMQTERFRSVDTCKEWAQDKLFDKIKNYLIEVPDETGT